MTTTLSGIGFGKALSQTNPLSNEEFLTQVRWASSAQKTLTQAALQGDVRAFCCALRKHALGTARRGGAKKASSKQNIKKPSLWSRNAFDVSETTASLIDFWESFGTRAGRSAVKAKSQSSKRHSPSGKTSAGTKAELKQLSKRLETNEFAKPFELLMLFEILHEAGSELPDEILFGLWRRALVWAVELSTNLEEPDGCDLPPDQRLLILGELPWEAGLLFAGVQGASGFGKSGGIFLRKGLLDQTDTDGTPDAELLPRLSLWMAPLVRAAVWSHAFREKLWNPNSRERFHLLVKIVAPFCQLDGRFALGNGLSHEVTSLMTSASQLAGWRKRSVLTNLLQDVKTAAEKPRNRKSINGVKRKRKKSVGEYPVTQSDWARVACLRSDWSFDSDTLIVAHHTTCPMIDLTVLGDPLLSGTWDLAVSLDGKPIELDDEWTCCCWYSDEDADYMELNQALEGGVTIDRQILLSRVNHFALFADCISSAKQARIEYTSRLPLVQGVTAQTDVCTRESVLKVGKQKGRVFPLALPDDRVISTAGSLSPSAGQLELKQVAIGGLYAPVVIDWDPKLRNSYAEWRTLTITEENTVLKSDAAAGHRLRIGKQQLFLYRRLNQSEEPHTVLGHHTTHETVIGKFDKFGDVAPILLVE